MRIVKLGLIVPLLAACQQEVAPQETGGGLKLEPAVASQSLTYSCGRGQEITVTYGEGGLAHLTLDGAELRLTSRTAQRGVEYSDGNVSWVLVNRDNKEIGTLTNTDGIITQCSRVANTPAPPPTLTACRADQLEARTGDMDAGMGHRHLPVILALKGETGCLLPKWPQVTILQDTTSALKAERTTDAYFASVEGKERLELRSGDAVQFYLGWSVIPNEAAGESVCPQVRGWTITPPGGGSLDTIPADIRVCGGKVSMSAFTTIETNEDTRSNIEQ